MPVVFILIGFIIEEKYYRKRPYNYKGEQAFREDVKKKGKECEEMKTKFGTAVRILCIICLVGTALFLIIVWNRIPAEIAGHFNGAGEVDGTTGKGSLIFLHVISWLMFLGISALECCPEAWNVGVKVTGQNKARVYRNVYHMIACSKLAMVLIFCFMTIWSVNGKNMPVWFTPISLIGTFGPMLFFGIRLWRCR